MTSPNPAVPPPVRLRRSRAKGAKLVSPNGLPIVCVTRPGPFGNPFGSPTNFPKGPSLVIGQRTPDGGIRNRMPHDASEAVTAYRDWMMTTIAGQQHVAAARQKLRGKNLACYCALDKPCHADVLLELANAAPLAPDADGKPEEA